MFVFGKQSHVTFHQIVKIGRRKMNDQVKDVNSKKIYLCAVESNAQILCRSRSFHARQQEPSVLSSPSTNQLVHFSARNKDLLCSLVDERSEAKLIAIFTRLQKNILIFRRAVQLFFA